jgi:hypothetical protein
MGSLVNSRLPQQVIVINVTHVTREITSTTRTCVCACAWHCRQETGSSEEKIFGTLILNNAFRRRKTDGRFIL